MLAHTRLMDMWGCVLDPTRLTLEQTYSKPVRAATVEDSVEPAAHLTLKKIFVGSVIKDTREL